MSEDDNFLTIKRGDGHRVVTHFGEIDIKFFNEIELKKIAESITFYMFKDEKKKYKYKSDMVDDIEERMKDVANKSIFMGNSIVFFNEICSSHPDGYEFSFLKFVKFIISMTNMDLIEKYALFIYIGLPFTKEQFSILFDNDIKLPVKFIDPEDKKRN